jgi:hypothetical protein
MFDSRGGNAQGVYLGDYLETIAKLVSLFQACGQAARIRSPAGQAESMFLIDLCAINAAFFLSIDGVPG